MTAPTIEETQLLVEFRELVHDALETKDQQKTRFLLRWLRARNHDLKKAESMLRSSLAWRKANRIDHILEIPLEDYFRNVFPYVITRVDKTNHPVFVAQPGKWDFRKCTAEKTPEEIILFIAYVFEHLLASIEKVNSTRGDPNLYPVTQFTAITDWKDFSYWQLCSLKAIHNLLNTAIIYEAHYPEVLHTFVFLNCPGYFNMFITMVKQIVASRTFDKLKVYGPNRKEWEKVCLEIVDEALFADILRFFE